jgi:hypothetical protein
MNLKRFFFCSALLVLSSIPGAASAANMNVKEISAGWPLSATLALFRNVPLMEAEFPPSEGPVYFSHSEDVQIDKVQKFTNTYRFYRKTSGTQFLELTIVEEHKMGEKEDGGFYHHVADLGRSLGTVDSLPEKAKLIKDLSALLGYVLDNRNPLQNSEAAEMAKQLNYGEEGRMRTADYSQPRVSFVQNRSGEVEKVRIHGLTALLNRDGVRAAKVSQEDQILEMSVDASGVAKVSLTSPKLR